MLVLFIYLFAIALLLTIAVRVLQNIVVCNIVVYLNLW